ncbi:MAG TPA: phosphatidylglycerol lysyltransferase domain-containing protein [Acidimicrobiales bacterium]|jgi:lysylphosphatidylglycerol synthetase-like protein (DUF2156 family)|nr:phosphatidylglycerol lysyltransferase domain-containing protein [Acidimicrobiales bacterium]
MNNDPPIPSDPVDLITVEVPTGARVLIAADLHLTAATTPASARATAEVATAVDAWTGPGVLVVNGGLFDGAGGGDKSPGSPDAGRAVVDALTAHPCLTTSLASFAAGPGRRVVVLPGARDPELAWSPSSRAALGERLGAEVALAVELDVHTAAGARRVRVEPGHRYDALSARVDPRNPGETPLAHHLRTEMLTNVRRIQATGGTGARWLAGLDDLDDPAAFPRFLASRLAYRKLGRHAWLLLLPFVAAFVLRLPVSIWHDAQGELAGGRLGLLVVATVVELAVLAALVVVSLRRTWGAMASIAIGADADDGGGRRDPNRLARRAASELVTAGAAGLVTSHTAHPELVTLGPGFYANTGCAGDTVSEVASRLRGLGLPAVFVASRRISWVEIEAGAEIHLRLVHGRQELEGATVLERLVALRPSASSDLHLDVVATFPGGRSWPPAPSDDTRRRRVRRAASVFVAAAGFVSLVSAVAEPLRDRLHFLQMFVPIAVPEVAAALAALGGLGLLILARGVRRGQRRAWTICQVVLLVVAIAHLVKGVDVEETIVALAVAVFLWVNRGSFSAASDIPPLRRGVLRLVGIGVAVVVAGAVGLELGSWYTAARHHGQHRIGWTAAFRASVERLVGVRHVALPNRLDEFFTPAMATVGAALAVALAWLVLRPVVARRARGAGEWTPDAKDADGAAATSLARARSVVERHGSGTLDYFALRPDKQFYFRGDTLVAYAVYNGTCLVSPDPIGPPAEREEVWGAFRAFVDKRGWSLGVLGAGEEWLPIYRTSGMHDLYVGDEGVVRTGRFTLQGGRFKGLRQAVNRVAKYGYTISFHDPSALEPGLRAELEAVMTQSRRGDVERGFSMTLGRVFQPEDKGLLLAVVHAPAGEGGAPGRAVAFCQYVPAPGIGGYSLDLMRRDNGEHPNGLIDFAVVETIRHLQASGGEGLGLNFATMRAVLAGETGEGLSQKVQGWLLRRMGDSMQIESLWKFNAKFDPDWLPRYAIYDAPENALSTAIAVARAESFWELPVIGRFLVPSAGP